MQIVQEDEIDLLALAKVLWKNALAIALAAVVCGTAAFAYTFFFITPQYQATASLYVNNSSFTFGATSFSISSSELSASNSLVSTYVYILQSRTTLEDVISEANLPYTYEKLSKMVEAKSVPSTAAFEVTVTSTSPAEAELIANTITRLLPERISEIVDGSSVRIVDYAIIPAHRSSPNFTKNTAIGVLAGAVLACAVVILYSLLDERSKMVISSADELRTLYPDIMVLTLVPDMRISEKKNGYYSTYYASNDTAQAGGKTHGRTKGA